MGSQILVAVFERSISEFLHLENDEAYYDSQLKPVAEAHPVLQRLMKIRCVGMLSATAALAAVSDPSEWTTVDTSQRFLVWCLDSIQAAERGRYLVSVSAEITFSDVFL